MRLTRLALALAVTLIGAIIAAPAALAQPGTAACLDAEADLEAALSLVVQFDSTDPGDVYSLVPGDGAPAVDDITPATLQQILADPDLGGGARAEVLAAVAAFEARDDACAAAPPTTTPAPTTTVVPDTFDCDDFATRADAQAKLNEDDDDPHNLDPDNDGLACEDEFPAETVTPAPPIENNVDVDVDNNFDQIGRLPRGGVSTGGGDLAEVVVE